MNSSEQRPPGQPSGSGFVYVATGTDYIGEAITSVRSLLAVMPEARVALITDTQPDVTIRRLFETVIVRTDTQRRPIDKLLCWDAPFERCVFLDTDTHVCGDLSDLFALLDTFDLAVTTETLRGLHYALPEVPGAFSEFNTGVIAFRRNAVVADFFRSWRSNYEALLSSHGFVSDQPSFRWSAFRSSVRIAPLPSEFHFIALTSNYTMWQVRLVHGRQNPAGLAGELNRHLGARAYVPGLGAIASFQGYRHWLQQAIRLSWLTLRVALVSLRRGPQPRTGQPHWTDEEKRNVSAKSRNAL